MPGDTLPEPTWEGTRLQAPTLHLQVELTQTQGPAQLGSPMAAVNPSSVLAQGGELAGVDPEVVQGQQEPEGCPSCGTCTPSHRMVFPLLSLPAVAFTSLGKLAEVAVSSLGETNMLTSSTWSACAATLTL